jgi:phosphatidylcholine synthase
MTRDPNVYVSRRRRVAAFLVHLFTATGALFGLSTYYAIFIGDYKLAFWLMAGAVMVDAVDGILARMAQVKVYAANIDGELLDNILDYSNYVMAPAFLALVSGLLPPGWAFVGTGGMVLASAYQFTQLDAKTSDHFFKGFPSYWNIVVLYLAMWHLSPWVNLAIVVLLVILVFVPIKYVYPSRLDYLTHYRWFRRTMLVATVLWGLATAILLFIYPQTNPVLVIYSILYAVFYMGVSLYRTLVPLEPITRPPKKEKSERLESLRKLRQRRWPFRLHR